MAALWPAAAAAAEVFDIIKSCPLDGPAAATDFEIIKSWPLDWPVAAATVFDIL